MRDAEYLRTFDADAEGWADRERERDLMAVLVESAHLKSAARAWYRRQGVVSPPSRNAGKPHRLQGELDSTVPRGVAQPG